MADIHLVEGVLPEKMRVERPRSDGTPVTQIQRIRIVAYHVHLRAHKALIRSVVHPGLKHKQIASALRRQGNNMVGALRVGGGNLVARAVSVVVVGRKVACVANAEVVPRNPLVQRSAAAVSI